MKHVYPLFSGIFLITFSCEEMTIQPNYDDYSLFHVEETVDNRVSLDEAISMFKLSTKAGEMMETSIEPFVDNDGDTLMFFVNYKNGWRIVSTDKRTPMLIASSDIGHISPSTDNCGLSIWIELVAADMKRLIHSPDSLLSFSPEQIASHRMAWRRTPDKDTSNRAYEGPDFPIDFGDWLLVGTDTEEIYYDHINHLVDAHWDQNYPYNIFCPPKTSGTGNTPVGCTAVACGEMLQFLSVKYGMPEYFSYNGLNGQMSDLTLDYNVSSVSLSTSLLLRMLGSELGAFYHDDYTTVLFPATSLRTAFNNFGYICTIQAYSVQTVKQNLLGGMPVIVNGYRSTSLGNPDYNHGHAFIIDGYKRFRTKYTYYYERVIGNPPVYQQKTEIEYSSPHISLIKMNWGWKSQWLSPYDNDDWFALTGEWIVNSEGHSYTQDMSILCDFDYDPLNAWNL